MKKADRHNRFHCSHALRRKARGSAYLLTLGLAMVLTLIGVASVTAGRVGNRAMTDSQDWLEARSLAFAAAEHAMTQINRNSNWRTLYNGQTTQKSLGRGSFTWQLTDETDNNLTDDASDPFVITTTGTVGRASYSMRVHMATSAGRIVAGATINSGITLAGNAYVDSYDSTNGGYGGSNVGAQSNVATNSTAAGAITLAANTRIRGSVSVGAGGDPASVIHSTGTITGTRQALSQPLSLTTPSAPTGMGSSTGNVSYQGNNTDVISHNMHVGSFQVKANHQLQISGNIVIQADGDVTIWNNAGIEVLPGSSLTIYFSGQLDLHSNGVVDGQNLSRMQFINLGTGNVNISDNSSIQGAIISPNSTVTLTGNGQVYGAVVARTLSMDTNAALHEDKRITGQVDPINLGSSGNPKPDSWGRIVQ